MPAYQHHRHHAVSENHYRIPEFENGKKAKGVPFGAHRQGGPLEIEFLEIGWNLGLSRMAQPQSKLLGHPTNRIVWLVIVNL